jgi:protein O-mannosyl-transferase
MTAGVADRRRSRSRKQGRADPPARPAAAAAPAPRPVREAAPPTSLVPRPETIAWAALLAALVLVAYIPAIRGGFVWDDDLHITNNGLLKDAAGLRRIWTDPTAMPQYYPLVFSTFWVEYHLWGLHPLGYHLDNVLLHAASAIVLWRLLARLAVPAPWLAAAVFALHPVHVESVAWATERKNALSGLCYLLAFSAWVRFALEERRRPWAWYGVAAVLFVAALLAKTVTASLPAAAGLVLWWKRGRLGWRDLAPLVPLAVLGVALGLNTAALERSQVGAQGVDWSLTFVERCLIAGRALWFYSTKLVWPFSLAFIYPRWRIDAGAWWQYLFPLAAVAVVVALWAARERLGRAPLAAVLFFGGTLFPALGFVDVFPMRYSFVADHFQYLASLGLIVLGVGAAATAVARWGVDTRVGTGLAAVVLAVFATLGWRQGALYADAETLYTDTLAKNPDCWLAHNNLAVIQADSGRGTEAATHYEAALRLRPQYAEARSNYANLLVASGRYEEATVHYREALRAKPGWSMGHSNFALALLQLGRYDEALVEARAAVRLDARSPQAHNQLASALAKTGRPQEAIAEYREALRLMPGFASAERRLAWLLATWPDPALRNGAEAVRLAQHADERTGHRDPDVLDSLAAATAESGRFADAAATADRAATVATEAGKPALAAAIRARAELYRAGRPFRDGPSPETKATPGA